jgi:hypothetical protein
VGQRGCKTFRSAHEQWKISCMFTHHSPLWLTRAPIAVVGGGVPISRPCRLAVAKMPDRSLRSPDGVNAPFICAEQMLLRLGLTRLRPIGERPLFAPTGWLESSDIVL